MNFRRPDALALVFDRFWSGLPSSRSWLCPSVGACVYFCGNPLLSGSDEHQNRVTTILSHALIFPLILIFRWFARGAFDVKAPGTVRQMQKEHQDSMAGGALGRVAVLEQAVAELVAAGVRSPHDEAELLAAHVLGVPRAELTTVEVFPAERVAEFRELVSRRAQRVPSARLVGTVRIGPIDIEVGPGVYVPQVGTELTLEWAVQWLATQPRDRTVVDLCTGSGAAALGIANLRPDAIVHGVELNPAAMAWAQRNAAERVAAGDTPITLHTGDWLCQLEVAPG